MGKRSVRAGNHSVHPSLASTLCSRTQTNRASLSALLFDPLTSVAFGYARNRTIGAFFFFSSFVFPCIHLRPPFHMYLFIRRSRPIWYLCQNKKALMYVTTEQEIAPDHSHQTTRIRSHPCIRLALRLRQTTTVRKRKDMREKHEESMRRNEERRTRRSIKE